MELIVPAAIVAVAIMVAVLAFVLVTRRRRAPAAPAAAVDREELVRLEERLNARAQDLDRRVGELDDQTRALEAERDQLARRRREHETALEQISGLSAGQAKQRLMAEITDQVRHESTREIRQIEEQTKRGARSSPSRCSAWPRATPPRRRSASCSCRPTT